MCGIYGMVSLRGAPLSHPDSLLAMAKALAHRGPDGSGRLTRSDAAMGTERLRVVDLDPRADQPFVDPRGTVWLACNGEVYNAPELRRRFPSYRFRSRSDVETILPLFLATGIDAPRDIDGMFALSLWNTETRRLVLARDRSGEKPLFYLRAGGEIWFASEIGALLACPSVSRDIDAEALAEYRRAGYVSAPRTMFAHIRQIEPGTVVAMDAAGTSTLRYWDPSAVEPLAVPAAVAAETLRDLLDQAICRQLAADVPVGVFTSGGLDSTILAARAARALGPARVRTFAARFVDRSYDESAFARRMSRALGTRHVDVVADETALRQALDRVTASLAEPVNDPAILPTFLLADAARAHVTVVLSGEGADELFGGYPTYLGHRLAPAFATLPPWLRHAIRASVRAMPSSSGKVTMEFLLKRFIEGAGMGWRGRHELWFGTGLDAGVTPDSTGSAAGPGDDVGRAMLLDYRSYLPGMLLTKIDRATMLASLEARAPYLDRAVAAFALALPSDFKVRGLQAKWILRQAAAGWVPDAVVRRRKRGLSVPVASWINRGLRDEVDRLLDPDRLKRQGLIDHLLAGRLLDEHRAGRANHARGLWALIIFQRWFEHWCEEEWR
jgi:asparagine synthase (glutamine-hydrolysing)